MICIDHLFRSWDEFKKGKRKRKDIQQFERNLEDNIFQLHRDLETLQYHPDPYENFYVSDPKQRRISKASVKDRFVHHIVYNTLTPVFDQKFIFHSLSSRRGKGIHVGVDHLRRMIRKVSKNGHRPCFALKMDIQRFFDSVDHQILKTLIQKTILDEKVLKIIALIINSFRTSKEPSRDIGIPLGNVTSQLFANIYLHELDLFIKQTTQEKYYLRYCDDFIILSDDEHYLKCLIARTETFLLNNLHLRLHPRKTILRKLSQGIDFVGYVLFERYTLVRAKTKQRMQKKLKEAQKYYLLGKISATSMDQTLQSYLGILSHANQHTLSQAIKNAYWIRDLDGKIPFF